MPDRQVSRDSQQRLARAATSAMNGGVVSQRSNRCGHRSRNEQPSPSRDRGTDLARDPLAAQPSRPDRVLAGDRRQQRPGVGVMRVVEDRIHRALLDDLAQVHHRHPVGRVVDDRQVVGDEQVGEPVLLLEVLEQVDDLRLDGHVQGRHRLVEHQQLGLHGQRPGDADALSLTTRQLMRVSTCVLRPEPDVLEQRGHALATVRPVRARSGGRTGPRGACPRP